MQETLSRWLASSAGEVQFVEHPAVHTIDEALMHVPAMPGLMVKNLFVRDEKGRRHVLVIVPFDKRVDLAALGRLLPASKLSMASPERLLRHLGITPGSVSLFALIHDEVQSVELVLDQAVWDAGHIQAHPLRNTATVALSHATLVSFLAHTGHAPRILDVPAAG
ncbi:prolyl-tRNA synthetase associated domain-containing protein [Janthinobacterium sp. BJB1]|uniref:prolyl-tRNA synthetase associated domain-containing protein n=1 Tax=Janthinobacterium sp. GW458P TaxID=1981504 RepID=UPI000A326EF1|nr:prolyl-tRNA synthetase associated domain-containing protein [Janthinobacterium sp. GW458P]MBE3026933.1 prolyl-tRNA synthetase associated domain-containing protein [Janthinobacterium sp. GW458P]PHV15972.1 prolyl-tRNA synthetase associated domain-containing protein [Janthinobacterium sp. BJB303]PJC96249.1 prolyl-tRNA synthetase associated domain-containing protein [Janthinobacterium sp. BJB1]